MHFYLRHVTSVSFHRITVLKIKDNEVLENGIKVTDEFMKAVICCLKLEKNELFCVLSRTYRNVVCGEIKTVFLQNRRK